jgi:hypothetical protein
VARTLIQINYFAGLRSESVWTLGIRNKYLASGRIKKWFLVPKILHLIPTPTEIYHLLVRILYLLIASNYCIYRIYLHRNIFLNVVEFHRRYKNPVDVIVLKIQILIKFSYRHLQWSYIRNHAHAYHIALRSFKPFENKIKWMILGLISSGRLEA